MENKISEVKDLIERIQEYKQFIELFEPYGCQPLRLENGFYDKGGRLRGIDLYEKEAREFKMLFKKQLRDLESELNERLK